MSVIAYSLLTQILLSGMFDGQNSNLFWPSKQIASASKGLEIETTGNRADQSSCIVFIADLKAKELGSIVIAYSPLV